MRHVTHTDEVRHTHLYTHINSRTHTHTRIESHISLCRVPSQFAQVWSLQQMREGVVEEQEWEKEEGGGHRQIECMWESERILDSKVQIINGVLWWGHNFEVAHTFQTYMCHTCMFAYVPHVYVCIRATRVCLHMCHTRMFAYVRVISEQSISHFPTVQDLGLLALLITRVCLHICVSSAFTLFHIFRLCNT